MPLLILFPLPEIPFSLQQTPAHPQHPGEVTFPPSLLPPSYSPLYPKEIPPSLFTYIMHTLVITVNTLCFRCLFTYPFLLLDSELFVE